MPRQEEGPGTLLVWRKIVRTLLHWRVSFLIRSKKFKASYSLSPDS
jgi:hypothetical protein